MAYSATRGAEGRGLRAPTTPNDGFGASFEQPTHVRDELAWELVRDEWELLLAVGSGPTSVEAAAKSVGGTSDGIAKRIKLLLQHGLVVRVVDGGEQFPETYRLVAAFYERREGMSSYLRDLVLRRLQDGAAPPLAGLARLSLGDPEALAAFIARAELELFPAVVALANRPESERSERFSLFFAAADCPDAGRAAIQPYDGQGFREQLLCILKAAATAKSLKPETRSAYLWVAEMRVDPEVAVEIGELFERFLETDPGPAGVTPTSSASRDISAAGTAAFAVLPANRTVPVGSHVLPSNSMGPPKGES